MGGKSRKGSARADVATASTRAGRASRRSLGKDPVLEPTRCRFASQNYMDRLMRLGSPQSAPPRGARRPLECLGDRPVVHETLCGQQLCCGGPRETEGVFALFSQAPDLPFPGFTPLSRNLQSDADNNSAEAEKGSREDSVFLQQAPTSCCLQVLQHRARELVLGHARTGL